MSPDLRRTALAAALALLAAGASGCPRDKKGGGDDETPTPSPTATQFASLDGNVKFKRAQRLRNDLAAGLGLATNELCNELGQYSCTDTVHPVALGEVEPYQQGIYEPPEATGLSAPLVIERIAMAGCITRVDRDLTQAPTAGSIFLLDVAGDGTLVAGAASEAKARTAIATLYRRVTGRAVEAAEEDRLFAMYGEVAASGQTPAAARDWAVLACFAVASSTESIFY